MATVGDLRLLYLFFCFANTIQLVKTESNKLFVAVPSIGTYMKGNLSVLEIRQAKSEIQCALQCLEEKQCMAMQYEHAHSKCQLYHDADHLADPLPQQIFRAIGKTK